jgi:hypothetical protein
MPLLTELVAFFALLAINMALLRSTIRTFTTTCAAPRAVLIEDLVCKPKLKLLICCDPPLLLEDLRIRIDPG